MKGFKVRGCSGEGAEVEVEVLRKRGDGGGGCGWWLFQWVKKMSNGSGCR